MRPTMEDHLVHHLDHLTFHQEPVLLGYRGHAQQTHLLHHADAF